MTASSRPTTGDRQAAPVPPDRDREPPVGGEASAGALIRPFAPGDTACVLAANEASLPAVNSLTEDDLADLVGQSAVTLVAEVDGAPAGLLICLDHTARYASRNFAWLKDRLGTFAYVDRIALAPGARGRGLGEALYRSLLRHLAADPRHRDLPLACEVNSRPANPGSLRFHQRLGFREIGSADHGDKAVIYLARPVLEADAASAGPARDGGAAGELLG